MKGACYTGEYRNLFKEAGYSDEEIQAKIKKCFNTVFYGGKDERFFEKAGEDMGYFIDTGNIDAKNRGNEVLIRGTFLEGLTLAIRN